MKIIVVCGNDLGANLTTEMSTESILKDLFIGADVDHVDPGSAKGMLSDIYVGTGDITGQSTAQSVVGKIVALENTIDKRAMKERSFVALIELDTL